MSKKYSLKIYNNNKYGMIINSYKVYDGGNNLISSGTNVSVNANSNVVLGTQTLADTDTCYWGGSEAKYTSVGAPIEVSDTLTRSDYKLYTLLATSTTTTYGLNNYSIALNLNFTNIASTGAKTFEISNTSDFVVKKTLAITLSGKSYNYTATLTQSDFTGVLSSGLTNTLYLRDITNETPILFLITNTVNYFKLASPTISGVDNGSAYEYTVTNPNAYACSVFASNSSSNYVNKGTINANGTLTFTSNSNGIYVYLGGDYFTNSEVVSYAITYFNLTLHSLKVSTTGKNGTYVSKSFTSYTEQYQSIDELYANGMSDWLAQSSYTGYNINNDSSNIFLNTGANYFMDMYIYNDGIVPTTTSVPVSVTMEDDGQGGWRSQVVITNNSTYTLSGTLTDFTINVGTEISSVTLSSMAPNTTQTKYGNVAHTSTESGQLWNLTLNLTDGTTNWTLNYEGTLA